MFKSTLVMVAATFAAVLVGMFLLDRASPDKPSESPMAAVAVTEESASLPAHATAVPKAADGHFWVEARVNDKAVKFLVDTGASVVALTPADAQRLGINMQGLTFDKPVMTANGKAEAAEVMIASLSVGESRVDNVRAMVIRDGLSTSLLGMSYLGRLSRIEATPRSLILHP
jgi:aspartyl protease family protein